MRRAFYADLSDELAEFPWWKLWLCVIAGVAIGFGLSAWLAHEIAAAMARALGL